MQKNEQNNKIDPAEVAEMRGKLPATYNKIICEMINYRYKPSTIMHMFLGNRKMKPVVFEAAKKLINTLENLKQN